MNSKMSSIMISLFVIKSFFDFISKLTIWKKTNTFCICTAYLYEKTSALKYIVMHAGKRILYTFHL